MSEREAMTKAEEQAETIREFVMAQDEPSDFVLSALASMERQIKALADALGALRKDVATFNHAEACEVEDEGDPDETDGCRCPLRLLGDIDAALRLAGRL